MGDIAWAASGAALVLAAATSAAAFETVIGGLAGECSALAREGRSDQRSLEICSTALSRELLGPRERAGTLVNRGAMRLLGGSREQAHLDFRAALKLQPDMGEAHVGEGVYLISREQWADAERSITRGLELGSEEPEKGYYFRGVARWGQDDLKGAYLDFSKAAALKPGWALPRQELAHFTVTPAR